MRVKDRGGRLVSVNPGVPDKPFADYTASDWEMLAASISRSGRDERRLLLETLLTTPSDDPRVQVIQRHVYLFMEGFWMEDPLDVPWPADIDAEEWLYAFEHDDTRTLPRRYRNCPPHVLQRALRDDRTKRRAALVAAERADDLDDDDLRLTFATLVEVCDNKRLFPGDAWEASDALSKMLQNRLVPVDAVQRYVDEFNMGTRQARGSFPALLLSSPYLSSDAARDLAARLGGGKVSKRYQSYILERSTITEADLDMTVGPGGSDVNASKAIRLWMRSEHAPTILSLLERNRVQGREMAQRVWEAFLRHGGPEAMGISAANKGAIEFLWDERFGFRTFDPDSLEVQLALMISPNPITPNVKPARKRATDPAPRFEGQVEVRAWGEAKNHV